jgi:DNA-binding XRE family transcriptional regulator
MKTLSSSKLAVTITNAREVMGYTKEKLGSLTGIHRIMIGRIEKENFIPSIVQLEALSNVLEFDISDLFIENKKTNTFIALRSETLSNSEKEGLETFFKMMLSLRQQIYIRRKFDNESSL